MLHRIYRHKRKSHHTVINTKSDRKMIKYLITVFTSSTLAVLQSSSFACTAAVELVSGF